MCVCIQSFTLKVAQPLCLECLSTLKMLSSMFCFSKGWDFTIYCSLGLQVLVADQYTAQCCFPLLHGQYPLHFKTYFAVQLALVRFTACLQSEELKGRGGGARLAFMKGALRRFWGTIGRGKWWRTQSAGCVVKIPIFFPAWGEFFWGKIWSNILEQYKHIRYW